MTRFSSTRKLQWLLVSIIAWILLQTVYIASLNYSILCAEWQFSPRKLHGPMNRSIRSSCGLSAGRRGDHQNVISFSIYGDFSQSYTFNRYLRPFKDTVHNIASLYPGWIVRVYHNVRESDTFSWQVLQSAFSSLEHVDLCNASQVMDEWQLGDLFPMTWRFLPLLDQSVDRVLSRDSDSPILQREVDAVGQWLQSDKIFHAMRDNPYHCFGLTLLGGMWGAKVFELRETVREAALDLLSRDHWHKKGCDQDLLEQFLLPLFQQSLMSHDSFCCDFFPDTRPFPSQRVGNSYVGMMSYELEENPKVLRENTFYECPESCRPQIGMNWTSC